MKEAHDQLKLSMQREVALMRELLANMHQEELFLMMNDHESWDKVMEARSDMVLKLITIRNLRALVTEKFKKRKISLKEILSSGDENSAEILTLLDQIMALVERMNLQNARNDYLFYQMKGQSEYPLHCPYPPPNRASEQPKPKKISVATYQNEDNSPKP